MGYINPQLCLADTRWSLREQHFSDVLMLTSDQIRLLHHKIYRSVLVIQLDLCLQRHTMA